jgi:hypothetical protein
MASAAALPHRSGARRPRVIYAGSIRQTEDHHTHKRSSMAGWRKKLFVAMAGNAASRIDHCGCGVAL